MSNIFSSLPIYPPSIDSSIVSTTKFNNSSIKCDGNKNDVPCIFLIWDKLWNSLSLMVKSWLWLKNVILFGSKDLIFEMLGHLLFLYIQWILQVF